MIKNVKLIRDRWVASVGESNNGFSAIAECPLRAIWLALVSASKGFSAYLYEASKP